MSFFPLNRSRCCLLLALTAALSYGVVGTNLANIARADCSDPGADPDVDSDNDGVSDCEDACPSDSAKTSSPGFCGCGVSESDTDKDGAPNCIDLCPSNSKKVAGGKCGCDYVDTGIDIDGEDLACDDLGDGNKTGLAVKVKNGTRVRAATVTYTFDRYLSAVCSWRIDVKVGSRYKKLGSGTGCIGTYTLPVARRSAATYRIVGKLTSGDGQTETVPTSVGFSARRS